MTYNNTYDFQAISEADYNSATANITTCLALIQEWQDLAATHGPGGAGNGVSVGAACSSAYGDCYLNIEAAFPKSGVSLDQSLHLFVFLSQDTDSPFSMILSMSGTQYQIQIRQILKSDFSIRIEFRKRLGLLSTSHTRILLCTPVSAHSRFATHNPIRKFGFDINSSSGKLVGLLLHIEYDSRGSPIYASFTNSASGQGSPCQKSHTGCDIQVTMELQFKDLQ